MGKLTEKQYLYRRFGLTLVYCTPVKTNKDGTIQIIPSGWTKETTIPGDDLYTTDNDQVEAQPNGRNKTWYKLKEPE